MNVVEMAAHLKRTLYDPGPYLMECSSVEAVAHGPGGRLYAKATFRMLDGKEGDRPVIAKFRMIHGLQTIDGEHEAAALEWLKATGHPPTGPVTIASLREAVGKAFVGFVDQVAIGETYARNELVAFAPRPRKST